MAKTKSTLKKNINAMRVQAIESYDYSWWNYVNPNTKNQLKLNPIGVQVSLRTLKELRAELEDFDIDIKEIDCNRIFNDDKIDLTETEVFVRIVIWTIEMITWKWLSKESLKKLFP